MKRIYIHIDNFKVFTFPYNFTYLFIYFTFNNFISFIKTNVLSIMENDPLM